MREIITIIDNNIIADDKTIIFIQKNKLLIQNLLNSDKKFITIINENWKPIILKVEVSEARSSRTNFTKETSKKVWTIIQLTDEYENSNFGKKYKKLLELINTFPQWIVQITPKWKLIEMNKTMIEKFGYTKEEIDTKFEWDILHLVSKKDLPKLKINIKKVLDWENISGKERYNLRAKDGTIIPVTISSIPFYDDKNSKYIFAVIYDLTSTIQYEEQIKKDEKEKKDILDNMWTWIIILEKDGKLSFSNNKIQEITGYSKDELMNLNVFDLIHPDYKKIMINNWKKRLEWKEVPTEYSFKMINKNWEIKHLLVHIVYNQDWKILASYTDITELEKTKEAISESEEKFRNVFFHSGYPIFILSKDGQIEDVNNAWCNMFGYSKKQLLKMSAMDVSAESKETKKSFKEKREDYYERLLKSQIEQFFQQKCHQSSVKLVVWKNKL